MSMDLLTYIKLMQANAFVFYTKAHGYHWNVEGILFKELHAFFKEIYEDVWESIDDYAEWLRRLGEYAVFEIPMVYEQSNVKYDIPTTSPIEMIRNLIASNDIIIQDLNRGFASATEANEQGLANFIAERIDQHQFWRWQLTASVKTMVN
jgi:starvation-inducible DNA-binding protein